MSASSAALDTTLLSVLADACDAVGRALGDLDDWGPSGIRAGQYQLDIVADRAAVPVLLGSGLAVLSEESGLSEAPGSTRPIAGAPLLAVLDPVDGSTNAHRHIAIYSTSICVLDELGPRVAMVVNQATGVTYQAVRGGGAFRDGERIGPSSCTALGEAIVGISGFPSRHPGWAQFRALGAASLELCAVAEGVLDGYLLVGGFSLHPWDYLGGLLICQEAGAVVGERDGQELVMRTDASRRPVAGGTSALLRALLDAPV